jgi:hypothetical protein
MNAMDRHAWHDWYHRHVVNPAPERAPWDPPKRKRHTTRAGWVETAITLTCALFLVVEFILWWQK